VLLLDEIEKAHPDLFNILLQVMDHGSLTDHNGKKIDFRNVILIMTTNAGASDMARPAIGFGSSKRTGEDVEALNRLFTPEFRNRLDAVIPFASLPTPVIHKVVQKFVMQLETQLAERNVTFDLAPDAVAWLAEQGYDEKMGARPLARVIQENIKKPLADEILFGKLKKGGVVKVTIGTKEDGSKGLMLEAVPETAPIKPKAEVSRPASKSAKPRKGEAKEPVAAEADPKAKPKKAAAKASKDDAAPLKGRTVPKVPRKK
jgi:ATP-dependent Clp protease ATP-binding subunit ClpA